MNMINPEYQQFLASKAPRAMAVGLQDVPEIGDHLFPFQRDVASFALRVGRCGVFLDTGLGKTLVQLEWCKHAAAATNGRALILTPLAVARQIEREGARFGYYCRVIRDQSEVTDGISVCNYDRLDRLDCDAFGAVALDESSILKSFTGKTTRALIQAFAGHRFRLCATATPAPNDHTELANHADFLGLMSPLEMLSRWFINDTSTASQTWRLKKHAEREFWQWMTTWARMATMPSDLGHDDAGFVLPEMRTIRHATIGNVKPTDGLFAVDTSATGIHAVKRQTANARAACAAEIVAAEPDEPWVIWCDTDYEADAITAAIEDAVEVRGSHPVDRKEQALAAFADGTVKRLVTKPSVCGFGLNWQHCARVIFAGRTFSYESFYQAVRRCWRFGQQRPVDVHLIVAEGEDQIGRVIDRKAADHVRMKRAMATAMRQAAGADVGRRVAYVATHKGRVPKWMV